MGIVMLTIWKYEIPIDDYFSLEIPSGYRVLNFSLQGGVPVIWVLVNTDNEKYSVSFSVVGTGNPLNERFSASYQEYVGTVLMLNDSLVWHLFRLN